MGSFVISERPYLDGKRKKVSTRVHKRARITVSQFCWLNNYARDWLEMAATEVLGVVATVEKALLISRLHFLTSFYLFPPPSLVLLVLGMSNMFVVSGYFDVHEITFSGSAP